MIGCRRGSARERYVHTFRGSWWTGVAGRHCGCLWVLLALADDKTQVWRFGLGRPWLRRVPPRPSDSGCERQEVMGMWCSNTGCLRNLGRSYHCACSWI